MAKIRYLAAFAAAFVWTGYSHAVLAQNPSSYYEEVPRTFYGGLLGGVNFTQVDGDSYAGYHKIGFNAGGIAYAQLAPKIAGSIEILFSQKGSRGHKAQESGNPGVIIQKYRIDLNYAEVPIQINYFDRRKSHFGGGLSYSQLISSNEKLEIQNGPGAPITPVNTDEYKFRKADINLILGGNLHLWQGLFLNARFQYSMIAIRKDIPEGYGRAEQYNNMWTLRLMYLF